MPAGTEVLAGVRPAAEAILPDVIAIRRRIHRRPEIGLRLPETQTVVAEALQPLGQSHRVVFDEPTMALGVAP